MATEAFITLPSSFWGTFGCCWACWSSPSLPWHLGLTPSWSRASESLGQHGLGLLVLDYSATHGQGHGASHA